LLSIIVSAILTIHTTEALKYILNRYESSGEYYRKHVSKQRHASKLDCSEKMIWSVKDDEWLIDANTIDYIDSVGDIDSNDSSTKDFRFGSFDFLRKEIGLNISREMSTRIIVPHHLTTASDVFCNREVNMQQIKAIGFDMDWTLAQYTTDFDLLAYNGARDKLVHWLGYPDQCLDLEYEVNICRRGNIIDKKRGNIIKLDQHKYVRAAEHGLTPLSTVERKSTYQEADSYSGPNYSNIDTPFSLVDACLFSQLVDLKDKLPDSSLAQKSYSQLWVDLRRCVDRCHRDGVIKLEVAKDPSRYIIYDPNIFPMLDGFRRSGRKVFLLTNSLWDYTQVVMNYLFARRQPGDGQPMDLRWADFFDVVIVGGNKPAFLMDEGSLPLYKVDPATGGVRNVEVPPSSTQPEEVERFLQREGHIFQGGNAPLLHLLLRLEVSAQGELGGSRLLYVGDHVYADIVRSKRSLGWRTCLIVPELTRELALHRRLKKDRQELLRLRKRQYLLERDLDQLFAARQRLTGQLLQRTEPHSEDAGEEQGLDDRIDSLAAALKVLRVEVRQRLDGFNAAFHPRWGQLFKAGFQESRIAKQIKDYACLYTSRASNLGLVSPIRPFRPIRDMMPHDHILEADATDSLFDAPM